MFEKLLKKNFESHRRLFDSPQFSSEIKVAVTATTISNAFPFVSSNYNKVGNRHSDSDKLMLKQV